MAVQYHCKNERRRIAVRDFGATVQLNGIDYLEVAADKKTLHVYLIHPWQGGSLTPDNILINGGTRLPAVGVESVSIVGNLLVVRVKQIGDFSNYLLQLVESPFQPDVLNGIDPQLSSISFSFWVDEVSDLDCAPSQPLGDKPIPPPAIDYLAKDYASFRRLMLDRLAVINPDWQERNPADIGVMLVELLAYSADHLSYYQDAVATEAYLGSARRRVSVRRHARLLDYFVHDGCNARVWIVLRLQIAGDVASETEVDLNGITFLGPDIDSRRPGIQFLSRTPVLSPGVLVEAQQEEFDRAINAQAQVFESLEEITVYPALDQLCFYTWGDEQCSLLKGATKATFIAPTGLDQKQVLKQLVPERVLIFQEILGPDSGEQRDADMAHRHAVRLTRVKSLQDPLTQTYLVSVEWHVDDALPFDFVISSVNPQGQPIENVTVAYGNVVLADAGRTRSPETLQDLPGWARLQPRLQERPLTQQGYVQNQDRQWVPFDAADSAMAAMQWQLRDVRPAIAVWETHLPTNNQPGGPQWHPQQDLLISDRFSRDFVVETEEDGRAFLRFGDGNLGKRPLENVPLYAVYRTGNGRQGNVGAKTLTNMMVRPHNLKPSDQENFNRFRDQITVFNPMAAVGGVEPEALEVVRRDAPKAFREQRRAVTAADYGTMAQKYPGVQRAVATRRWTGSWYTMFITVDRLDGRSVNVLFRDQNSSLKQELLDFLDEFRLSGHDIEIEDPRFVPLDIGLTVEVRPEYFRSTVKKALLETFSNQVLPDGRIGFFTPEQFTFGQPVYLSEIIATAVEVTGVQSVRATRFKRWQQASRQELEAGVIRCDRLEIIRLDNTLDAPENGRIQFILEGGL